MAITVLIIAACASLLRGGRYVYDEDAAGQQNTGQENPIPGSTVPGSTVPGNGTAANGADDPGPLADTALGTSPELAIEVAAEVADETARDPHP
jgi:hypothetical protein